MGLEPNAATGSKYAVRFEFNTHREPSFPVGQHDGPARRSSINVKSASPT
jgi:hypothetical protein